MMEWGGNEAAPSPRNEVIWHKSLFMISRTSSDAYQYLQRNASEKVFQKKLSAK